MRQAKKLLKKSLIVLVAIVQMSAFPLSSYATSAEDTTPPPEESQAAPENTEVPAQAEETAEPAAPVAPTPPEPVPPTPPAAPAPANPTTGPSKPTGADSKTYTFNEATGKWENDKYAWDPVTKETTNKKPISYSYNEEAGVWEEKQWEFDPASQSYVPKVISTSKKAPTNERLTRDLQSMKNLGIEIDNDATVTNYLDACAISGDATVSQNLRGGNATSGDAYAMANILNMLGSSWGDLGSSVSTFTTNIDGDVTGDLYINPAANQGANKSTTNNLNVNAATSGSINNEVLLCANSGNASVHANTNGGDARSGNADAVVNLMNLINSTINAGNSFVGVMNINGNFNGDILLPENLRLGNILAPKPAPLAATNTTLTTEENQLIADLLTHQNIDNNVTAVAESGEANVSKNTTAGDATSGSAQTNVTLLNLTGQDISANNGLLVFVNVLGTWVGFIVDTPAGSTTAALGSGVSNNSATSTGIITASEDYGITNNVTVAAESGDASVRENTHAGSATSGDTSASANILNLINSELALRDWFGVLFINVFGFWDGSFGVDTASGNRNLAALQKVAESQTVPVQDAQVFRFVPADTSKNDAPKLQNITRTFSEPENQLEPARVTLASAHNIPPSNYASILQPSHTTQASKNMSKLIAALNFGGILTLSFLGIEQLSNLRKKMRLGKNPKNDISSNH